MNGYFKHVDIILIMSSVGKKLNINFSRSKATGPGGKGKRSLLNPNM